MALKPPPCVIDQAIANDRVKLFLEKKKPALDRLVGYKEEISSISYSVDAFKELLNLILSNPGYNGFRVYLASHLYDATDPGLIPPGLEDNLTLIYVPTTNVNGLATDDLDNIRIIYLNTLVKLPNPNSVPLGKDKATKWVKYFQKKFTELEKDGVKVTGGHYWKETKSLWYDVESVKGEAGDPNLIEFMTSLQSDPNPLIRVTAQFACFELGDKLYPPYQMTLVFDLHQLNDAGPIKFALGTKSFALKDVPADTGLPCPPRICTGALLNP